MEVPTYAEDPEWVDGRGVGGSHQKAAARPTYLSTHELAKEIRMYPETVFRWCRKWFGVLPAERKGSQNGYRIPLEYRRVARVWRMIEHPIVREVARRALVTQPRKFVVVVATIGSTHYSAAEAVNRVESLLGSSAYHHQPIWIFNTEDLDEPSTTTTTNQRK